MSSIFANQFEINRICSWKDDLVILEDHEVRKYRLEDQLHKEIMYWEEHVQEKRKEKRYRGKITSARLGHLSLKSGIL